jgi:hypothetical protein
MRCACNGNLVPGCCGGLHTTCALRIAGDRRVASTPPHTHNEWHSLVTTSVIRWSQRYTHNITTCRNAWRHTRGCGSPRARRPREAPACAARASRIAYGAHGAPHQQTALVGAEDTADSSWPQASSPGQQQQAPIHALCRHVHRAKAQTQALRTPCISLMNAVSIEPCTSKLASSAHMKCAWP